MCHLVADVTGEVGVGFRCCARVGFGKCIHPSTPSPPVWNGLWLCEVLKAQERTGNALFSPFT